MITLLNFTKYSKKFVCVGLQKTLKKSKNYIKINKKYLYNY